MRTSREVLVELRRWREAAEERLAEIERQWSDRDIDDEDTLRYSMREHATIATIDAVIGLIEGTSGGPPSLQ